MSGSGFTGSRAGRGTGKGEHSGVSPQPEPGRWQRDAGRKSPPFVRSYDSNQELLGSLGSRSRDLSPHREVVFPTATRGIPDESL